MTILKSNYVIAIDGPAGAGKSTIAKLLSNKLRCTYIDSGAMYRAITLYMLENKLIDLPPVNLKQHIKKIKIKFTANGKKQNVYLNGKNVTKQIRSSIVNSYVSYVSSIAMVRKELVRQQRKLAKNVCIVMDGRDIGTNVFRNANLKIYLTANAKVRALRRMKDFKKIGEKVNLINLIRDIQNRDNYDSSRKLSPLCRPQGAVVIDSTNLTVNDILSYIVLFLPTNIVNG